MGKKKQYHLSFNIKAVENNIKRRRRRKFGEENKDFKKWGWEEYHVVGNFIHAEFIVGNFIKKKGKKRK